MDSFGTKIRKVPMPVSGYIVRDYEMDALPENVKVLLDKKDMELYMSIVGMLIWIQGVRLDIIFAVLYLSWYTKAPTMHHLRMACYVMNYLRATQDMPLVLGGDETLGVHILWDASHGSGPKCRSVTGQAHKLGFKSGAVSAKASAQSTII